MIWLREDEAMYLENFNFKDEEPGCNLLKEGTNISNISIHRALRRAVSYFCKKALPWTFDTLEIRSVVELEVQWCSK